MPITLASQYTVQEAVKSNSVEVVQNIDNPREGTLKSLVEIGGNPSARIWIDVYGPGVAGYNPEWMDADVEEAVKAWFAAQ